MGYIYQSMQQFYKPDSDHDGQDHPSIQAVLVIVYRSCSSLIHCLYLRVSFIDIPSEFFLLIVSKMVLLLTDKETTRNAFCSIVCMLGELLPWSSFYVSRLIMSKRVPSDMASRYC